MNDIKALKALKNKILSLAMQGTLLKQNENDEPASVLLEKIRLEKNRLKENNVKNKGKKKEITLPQINKDELPYKLPNSWQCVRLGEIGYTQTGTTPSISKEIYLGNYIPFVKPADIQNSKLIFHDYLSKEGLKYGRLIEKNSILMVCIGGSIGKCCYTNVDISCNQQINTFSYYFKPFKFYFYCLQSEYFQTQIKMKALGVATPIINKTLWENILVPLPPLAEQERIVAKIEEIFSIIDEIEKNITENKKISKILYNRLLSHAMQGKLIKQNENDEPASVLLEKIRLEKENLLKQGKLKKEKPLPPISAEEVPYKLPNSWQWVRLGEVCEISLGKTPKRDNKLYWNNGVYPWIKIGDMTTSNKYIYKTSEKISELAFKRIFNEKLIPKGSLIFSFKLSIGKVCILGMDALTNEAICTLKLYSVFQKYINYLYYILPHTNTNSLTNDAIKGKTLNSKTLPLILLPLPPLAEQERIVAKIEEIKEIIDEIG